MDEPDPSFLRSKQSFSDFLNPDNAESIYAEKIKTVINEGGRRLIISLNDMNTYKPEMRWDVLRQPLDHIPAWEEALNEYVTYRHLRSTLDNHDSDGLTKTRLPSKTVGSPSSAMAPMKIGLQGGFGSQRMTPQEMQASHVGSMVCVEGIVTKVSLVRPKVSQTVHYCEATGKYTSQSYRDATALSGLPTASAFPATDMAGNPLTTEFGLSTFINSQTVVIQDMPERTQAGLMPQSVECLLEDDLVDVCKPGDRIQMVGIYRALAGRVNGAMSGRMRTVVLCNHVRKIGIDDDSRLLNSEEIDNIKEIGKRKDVFELLSRSIVPSLYGHDYIKKAVVLQLLGGVEKNLDNGTHIRGDINILMMGDPSCGKSQMLRAVMNISPLAINTTGRGSSGVGLTAAVTMDKDTGERRLEAGAMVLADRGVVCIDEFDKMSDMDRTAIHEVMEQQTVTISKAGIHTSLNARCSVIAAANPIYGQYDRRLSPTKNIALPDSLLSRFDLLFIVLDKIDSSIDKEISEHVLQMHLTPHSDYIGSVFDDDADLDEINTNKLAGKNTVDVWETSLPQAKRMREELKRKKKEYLSKRQKSKKKNQSRKPQKRRQKKKRRKNGMDEDSSDGDDNELDDSSDDEEKKAILRELDGTGYLTLGFCKKYIEYAKKEFQPRLTDEACQLIASNYSELRKTADESHTLPITARCLETIIRLSTAVAKLRQCNDITEDHVDEAMDLLRFALTNDTESFQSQSKRNNRRLKDVIYGDDNKDSDDDNDSMDDDDDSNDEDYDPRRRRRVTQRRNHNPRNRRSNNMRNREDGDSNMEDAEDSKMSGDGDDNYNDNNHHNNSNDRRRHQSSTKRRFSQMSETEEPLSFSMANNNGDDNDVPMMMDDNGSNHGGRSSEEQSEPSSKRSRQITYTLDTAKMRLVKGTLSKMYRRNRDGMVMIDELKAELHKQNASMDNGELNFILNYLHESNKLFRNEQELHAL